MPNSFHQRITTEIFSRIFYKSDKDKVQAGAIFQQPDRKDFLKQMKAQADQKKADMETAMMGGEPEPEGMIFHNGQDGYDQEYGDEYEEERRDVFMMGGSRERK